MDGNFPCVSPSVRGRGLKAAKLSSITKPFFVRTSYVWEKYREKYFFAFLTGFGEEAAAAGPKKKISEKVGKLLRVLRWWKSFQGKLDGAYRESLVIVHQELYRQSTRDFFCLAVSRGSLLDQHRNFSNKNDTRCFFQVKSSVSKISHTKMLLRKSFLGAPKLPSSNHYPLSGWRERWFHSSRLPSCL